jgi:hypothetical protein
MVDVVDGRKKEKKNLRTNRTNSQNALVFEREWRNHTDDVVRGELLGSSGLSNQLVGCSLPN